MKDLKISEKDYQLIRVGDLVFDQDYQRKVNKNMIKKISEKYDRHLLDAIRVSKRDGKYLVLDGKHRVTAIKEHLGDDDTKVWCQVFTDIETYEEEALLFTLQQSSRKLSAIDNYNARIEARDELMLLIQNVVELNGFHINALKEDYNIGCVSALEKIAKEYDVEILSKALRIISETWNGNKPYLTGPIIRGLVEIIYTFDEQFDEKIFIKSLSRISITQLKRDATLGNTSKEYSIAMLNYYNSSTRKKLDIKSFRYK